MNDNTSHASRQEHVYVCLIITFTAAALALALRLIARRLTKVALWYDDYIAIVSFISASVWLGLIVWWLHVGLGRHLIDIPLPSDDILTKSLMILFSAELAYAFSLAFAKMAILAFYWRMFKTSIIRTPIKVLSGCAVLWLILRTFLAVFHCVPVQKFWNWKLDGVCRIDDSKFFFGTVLTHLIIDIVILALPVIEVQKLRLPLSQRVGIMGMFMFGIFVCIASIVVLVYSFHYDPKSDEVPWNVTPIIIWATVEINLAIVSACLPMLRPIWLIVAQRPVTKNSSTNSGYSPNSQQVSHKMTTLTTQKDLDALESESTHQLHKNGRQGSTSSTSSYDEHGNNTVITGSAGIMGGEYESRGPGGILVTSETHVVVSKPA